MSIYIVIVVIAVFACCFKGKYKVIGNVVSMLLMLAMFVVCAFRHESVGADTSMYLTIYNSPRLLEYYADEPIFYWLVKTMRDMDLSPYDAQFIMSLLAYIPLFWLFKRRSFDFSLSVLLFIVAYNSYFLETMNIVRQSISTPFLLWAYLLIDDKKYWKALICMLIAIGFHSSSLIYVPLIVLAYYVKMSNKLMLILMTCALAFALVFSEVAFIQDLIRLLEKNPILGLDKYSHYTDYKIELSRTLFGLIPMLVPTCAVAVYSYKVLSRNFLSRLFCFGVLFLCLVSIMPTSYRMAYGIVALELLLIPQLMKVDKKGRTFILAIVAFNVLYCLYRLQMFGDEVYKMY
ncbi:MAG: EpsG family protein [Muribaculaceae bacterium]|nr:EpsG family protein [Muribaculaceae bacterium]